MGSGKYGTSMHIVGSRRRKKRSGTETARPGKFQPMPAAGPVTVTRADGTVTQVAAVTKGVTRSKSM